MKAYLKKWWLFILILAMPVKSMAQEYKIWQFTPEQLPKIDGNATDWEAVPDSFVISIDRMKEDEGRYTSAKKSTLDVRVKVAWSPESIGCIFFTKPMIIIGDLARTV